MSYEYNPKSNVVFGNVDLSDYNAFAVYCNIFERPERDISVVSVPGRNGDLIFDNGRYKNVDRIYEIHVVGVENVHNLIRDLVSTMGYQRLEDEYEPNVYMMARIKAKPSVRKFVGNAVMLTVTFDRMPQKWDKNEGLSSSSVNHGIWRNGSNLTNVGAIYVVADNKSEEISNPTIKYHFRTYGVSGTSTLKLYVFVRDTAASYVDANETLLYGDLFDINKPDMTPLDDCFCLSLSFDSESYIELEPREYNIVFDSENQIVYDGDTGNVINDKIYGFSTFPKLKAGQNHVYVVDSRQDISISEKSAEISAKRWSL